MNILLIASMCWSDGLIRNSDSFETAKAISDLIRTMAKLIDSIHCWYVNICWVVVWFEFFLKSLSNEFNKTFDVLEAVYTLNLIIGLINITVLIKYQNTLITVSKNTNFEKSLQFVYVTYFVYLKELALKLFHLFDIFLFI